MKRMFGFADWADTGEAVSTAEMTRSSVAAHAGRFAETVFIGQNTSMLRSESEIETQREGVGAGCFTERTSVVGLPGLRIDEALRDDDRIVVE